MASSKPGVDATYYQAGSQESTADLIRAQDRARAMNANVPGTVKGWGPWLICAALLGGAVWYLRSTAD